MSPKDSAHGRHGGEQSLQQVASTVFALTAVLPLLIFVWILYTLDVLHHPHAQVGLGLSLVISVLGFAVLRITMRRTSAVLRLLVRAEMAGDTASRGDAAGVDPTGVPDASPTNYRAGDPGAIEYAPAVGAIRELREAADAVMARWKREAQALVGRPVVVSVINMNVPETGMLTRVTDDGVVLEQDGQEFGVLWRLVASVELDPRVGAMADTPT